MSDWRKREGGRHRRRARGRADPTSELGADATSRDYEQGAFSGLQVPEPPAELLRLLYRRTGLRVPLRVLQEYERLRAYCGYEGPPLSAALLATRRAPDGPQPEPAPEITTDPAPREPATTRPIVGPDGETFDPFDLGD